MSSRSVIEEFLADLPGDLRATVTEQADLAMRDIAHEVRYLLERACLEERIRTAHEIACLLSERQPPSDAQWNLLSLKQQVDLLEELTLLAESLPGLLNEFFAIKRDAERLLSFSAAHCLSQ